MIRRPVLTLVGCGLLVSAVGCRHNNNCSGSGGGLGLFSSGGQPPTRLTSGSPADACFSTTGGVPLTTYPMGGVPTTGFPGGAVPMVPGTIPGSRPDELPFPNPSDMIPRPAVPIPAPGDPGNIGTLPAPVAGQPVKGNK